MYSSATDPSIVCAPKMYIGSVKLYVYKLCTVVEYIRLALASVQLYSVIVYTT